MARSGLLLLLIGIFVTACSVSGRAVQETPTPFPKQVLSQRVTVAAPIPITLANLAANPDFFVGATLQLTGQYQRLPRLSCEGETFSSPASWGLLSDGYFANASGMDEQLRSLVDEGQTLTIEGRWIRFEGPVGCAPHAQEQTIWYLSVDRILDPHPLVRAQATAVAEVPAPIEPTAIPAASNTPELIANDTLPTNTPVVIATAAIPDVSAPTSVPELIPTATLSEAPSNVTPTATLALTATLSATTSPTATSAAAATATTAGNGGQATETATVTASASVTPSGSESDKGDLFADDLTIATLGSAAVDRWNLDLVAGDRITVTVAPGSSADIVLSVLDSSGLSLIDKQDFSSGGEVETITDLTIQNPGIHNLLIETDQGSETDYALMFMDSESYTFIFRGLISNNTSRNDSLAEDNDHFWFFTANSGQSASFTVTPDDNSDPYIELYDPSGTKMLTIDDTGEGEVESLNSYTLVDGGLYSIRIAEFDFRPMSYELALSNS